MHVVSKKLKYLTLDYIEKNIFVCNGGDNECDGIQNTSVFENIVICKSVTVTYG